jgi:hypothetical protein
MLTGCLTKYKIPSQKYGDNLLSTTKEPEGLTTYKFNRHNLTYIDKAKSGKLIERKVYDNDQIVYRYPILKTNIGPTQIFLKSGNDFLAKMGSDTVIFINNDLPIMNRHFWGKGIVFSRVTENTYLVKPTAGNSGFAKFYVSTTHNYEEIKNDNGFIADSLILPIR